MRTGTYNRFQNLWLYADALHGTPGGADYNATTFREKTFTVSSCSPGTGFWSLAEIGNRTVVGGGGSTASIGAYQWPRFRLNALGPAFATDTGSGLQCSATSKIDGEAPALELKCATSGTICVNAEQQSFPIGCADDYWFERFGVRWEYSNGPDSPWLYLPQAELNLYGNRIAIGQTTQQDSAPATEINTQFYGIIDSVRISRGACRYSGDAVMPYDPREAEETLIDEHVIFALNLGRDPNRLPGGTNIRYYVRNRGWLDPSKSTEGLITLDKNITVTAATTAPISPFPPTVANISGQPAAILIDGYAVQIEQVVLIKNQPDASQNGLWVVKNGAPWEPAILNDSGEPLALSYGTAITVVNGSTNAGRNFYLVTPNAPGTDTIPAGGQEWIEQVIIPSLRRFDPAPTESAAIANFYADRQALAYSNFESGYKNSRPGIMFPAHDDFQENDVTQGLYISDIQLFAPPELNRPHIINMALATTDILQAGLFNRQEVDGTTTSETLRNVLVKNQRDPRQNGVYKSGLNTDTDDDQPWTRLQYEPEYPNNLSRTYIKIDDGEENIETCWYSTSGDIELDAAPLYFARDEIFGVYRDDFCIEAYFKVAGFLHPATQNTTNATTGDLFPGRLGQNMTLIDTYRRIGTESDKLESGVRIYFRPVDNEHSGQIYVEVGPYAAVDPKKVTAHVSTDGWKGPAMQSDVIFANRFYHVAVVRERGKFRLYVDGELQDQFIGQSRQILLENRTTLQNDIRYRARAFFGPWHEDKTGFIRCVVRPPEFYYDRELAPPYARDYNGAAGMIERDKFTPIVLNLPANWKDADPSEYTTATWPGLPIPSYPSPTHIYVINDNGNPGTQIGIEVKFWPSVRFPPDSIYADVATNDPIEDRDFFDRPLPNSGHQSLFGLTDFIDLEPNNPINATLTFDQGVPDVGFSAPFGKNTQVTTGNPTVFTCLFHGFSVGDTVVFRFLSETTDAASERLVDITHGTTSNFRVENHGFLAGQRIIFKSSGGGFVPAGLVVGVPYYVLPDSLTEDTFIVSRRVGGTPVTTSVPVGVTPADMYVSLVLNGLELGAPYYVLAEGFDENVFRVSPTPGGTPIECFGPVTGALYATNTAAVFTTETPHTLTANQRVVFKIPDAGSLPAGLFVNQPYYVAADGLTATSFRVSSTINGAALRTVGRLTGALLLVRRPTAVQLPTGRLSANSQFIFSANVVRIIGDTEKVTAINRDSPDGIFVSTGEGADGSGTQRVYNFSPAAEILVALDDILSRGAIIANDPAASLPQDVASNVYYYASSEGPDSNKFYFSAEPNGAPIYGYSPTLNTTETTVNVRLPANLSEIPLQIDNTPISAGMRVLVKNQNETSKAQNGVYFASETQWSRVPELSTSEQLRALNVRVYINGGAINSNEGFLLDMTSDDSPAKDILPRNYRINETPLLFVVDEEDYDAPDDFECYVETGRAVGGDPRRYVSVFSVAERDELPGRTIGTFVKIEDGSAGSFWVLVDDTAGAEHWLEQAEENLEDAITVVLNERAYEVTTFTVANVNLFGTPPAAAIDRDVSLSSLDNKLIFVRKQTNPAENGVYTVSTGGPWSRAGGLSQSDDFFDGLYIVPSAGDAKTIHQTVGFKLQIPPDFVLNETPVLCYENPNPIDGDGVATPSGFYDNQIFRLTKLYLPIDWRVVTNVPERDTTTRLPLIGSGTEVKYTTFVSIGGGAQDDKFVTRTRVRCKFASATSDVVGRYLITRMSSILQIPANVIDTGPSTR